MHPSDSALFKFWCGYGVDRVLDFGTIRKCETFMGRILGSFGYGVLEALQGFADRVEHGDVDIVFWVVPIDGQSAVLAAAWVDGDGVILSERINEVGGVVSGKEFDVKVVYSKGEGGGKGRMCPKDSSIFHRGVSMGLEVFYKAFVGNDEGLLEPIHALPDIDANVAAQVSDGEERFSNNHLVGNVPEMDLHVLEVGQGFLEVVVDDVCFHIAGPFAGFVDGGVEMDIEVQYYYC